MIRGACPMRTWTVVSEAVNTTVQKRAREVHCLVRREIASGTMNAVGLTMMRGTKACERTAEVQRAWWREAFEVVDVLEYKERG
jgi:hypothetical protein